MQQSTQEPSQAYLIIQLGSRWTDVLRLSPEHSILVGRSSENQVVVKDERVSRHHSKFSSQKGGWVVEDLGSRNGTQVNGQTIDQPYKLLGGEEITVGGCRMTFTFQLAGAFPASALSLSDQNQATVDNERGAIVNRLSNSQWSTELDASAFRRSQSSKDRWSFFYKLVFDLVQCKSEEDAAGVALDLLLTELGLSAGGVLTVEINEPDGDVESKKVASQDAEKTATNDWAHSTNSFSN